MGHRLARGVFQQELHVHVQLPSRNLLRPLFFISDFQVCPQATGMSMGYSPIYDGPPEEDLFAHCLCFHWPALFYKVIQELHIPPRNLPATMTFLGLADIRLPHRQPHRCQEGLKISGDFHGLPEHSWPPSTPLHTLGQVQLNRYVWSVATLSWKASAVLELPRTWISGASLPSPDGAFASLLLQAPIHALGSREGGCLRIPSQRLL